METRGRKPVSQNSAQIKQQLSEIARNGIVYLKEIAEGTNKHRPANARIGIILDAISHTIGKPAQSHQIGIEDETTRAALELQAKLLEARPKGGNDGSNGEGEEGLPEGVYAKEEV